MQPSNRVIAIFFFVLLIGLLIAVPGSQAAVTSVYVAQAQAGAGDGSSCQNAKPISFLNSGGNWGSGVAQIGVDTTVHLCGTITTAVSLQGSGSNGHPITIQWESGASVQACSTSGAVQLGGLSYMVLDLGGNIAAISCPNNGSALSTQVNAIGISDAGSGFHNIEIRNGSVGPMYVYSGNGNNGFGSTCISVSQNASSSHVHDLALKGCAVGIDYSLGPSNSTNDEFDHITVDPTVGRVINYASGVDGSTYTSTNPKIHDLDVNYSTVWAVPGDYLHYEWIHVYNRGFSGSNDTISNLQIYNNYFHGVTPNNGGSTGGIFISEGGSACSSTSSLSVNIFNNLVVNSPGGIGFSSGSGGFIYEQDCEHAVHIYNNTIDGGDNSMNSCFELNGTTGSSWTVENNICVNVQFAFYNPQGSGPSLTADKNIFYNIRSSGNGGYEWRNTVYNSIGNWRSATGQDATSSTASPALNSDYTISSSSSGAYRAGDNLWSLNMTPLDTGKPATVGEGGTIVGVGRSSSLAWDLGAYPMSTGSVQTVNPPTGLSATVQ